MKERHKAVPAVYMILRKGNEILLSRRLNTGYYDGWYSTIAGHVEEGELPVDTLIREAREEIGISFNKNDAKLIHTMYRTRDNETGDRADYFFLVERWEGQIENKESHKCDDLKWFPLDDLPKNLTHHEAIAINGYIGGVNYSELPFSKERLNPNK